MKYTNSWIHLFICKQRILTENQEDALIYAYAY